MGDSPFLSVVTPTYNRKGSLGVTLDGLARQTYPQDRFEVVVISDGATDGTDAFLARYAELAPFSLRSIRQENAGPARARNRGVSAARGDVVVFLDDDVEPMPEFLEVHAAHHERDDLIVVIGPQSRDPERRRTEPVWIAWEHAMLEGQYEGFRKGVWEKGASPHNFYTGNASVRRKHILTAGGFNETFKRQEDVELAFRMERECGVRFLFDPGAAAVHRPSRSFDSWVRTPYAYGRLDVVRSQEDSASWETVIQSYQIRNWITRRLACVTLPRPYLSSPLQTLLKAVAQTAYSLPAPVSRMGVLALSTLYNVRYLEGARDALGSWSALRQIILQGTAATSRQETPSNS